MTIDHEKSLAALAEWSRAAGLTGEVEYDPALVAAVERAIGRERRRIVDALADGRTWP